MTDGRRSTLTSLTTAGIDACTEFPVSLVVNDVVLLIASIRPDLFTRRPPPYSGMPTIKEGFRVKVKHLRC